MTEPMELNERESSLLMFGIGAAFGGAVTVEDHVFARQLVALFKKLVPAPEPEPEPEPEPAPDPGEGHSQLDEMPADEPPVKPAKAAAAKATKKATRAKKR